MSAFRIQVDDNVKHIAAQSELNFDHSEDENAIMILDQHQNDLEEAEPQSSEDLRVQITQSFRISDLCPFQLSYFRLIIYLR